MSCITYVHNDPLDSPYGTKYISGTTCNGTTDVYYLAFGDSACMEAELPLVVCDGLTISGACDSPVSTPTPTQTPTNTSTPTSTGGLTPTPTSTTESTPTSTETPTQTPTQTPTSTSPGTTPTQTPTPSITQAITIYTHGTVRETCSDFCIANYNIDTPTSATANYSSLTIGDTIFGQGGVAGYVAYSNISTDTTTGPFRIAQIDSSGLILGVFICIGGTCEPL